MEEQPVLIVGAGIAGLCCAIHLHKAGRKVRIFEASDGIGGRVRTDKVDGFLLDRGFQVFLTEYSEARRMLRYRGLQLKAFYPGALVRWCSDFHLMADPFRKPHHLPWTLRSKLSSIGDGLQLMRWRSQLSSMSLHEIFSKPEIQTREYLEKAGFSKKFIDAFLRPFFAGVFLDPKLETSSRMLEFTYKTFASGRVTLPAQGMQAVPDQLARDLPKGTIELENPVQKIEGQSVTLESGEVVEGSAVVIASSAAEAYRLMGRKSPLEFQSTYCLYFEANEVPHTEHPILMLNGDGVGPINHLVVNSRVSRSYAPDGKDLVSVSVLQRYGNEQELEKAVRDQLLDWFGKTTENWRLIRCYDLPQALPQQRPPALQFPEKTVKVNDQLFICGDHREHSSLQGAMRSGRRAATALLSDL